MQKYIENKIKKLLLIKESNSYDVDELLIDQKYLNIAKELRDNDDAINIEYPGQDLEHGLEEDFIYVEKFRSYIIDRANDKYMDSFHGYSELNNYEDCYIYNYKNKKYDYRKVALDLELFELNLKLASSIDSKYTVKKFVSFINTFRQILNLPVIRVNSDIDLKERYGERNFYQEFIVAFTTPSLKSGQLLHEEGELLQIKYDFFQIILSKLNSLNKNIPKTDNRDPNATGAASIFTFMGISCAEDCACCDRRYFDNRNIIDFIKRDGDVIKLFPEEGHIQDDSEALFSGEFAPIWSLRYWKWRLGKK